LSVYAERLSGHSPRFDQKCRYIKLVVLNYFVAGPCFKRCKFAAREQWRGFSGSASFQLQKEGKMPTKKIRLSPRLAKLLDEIETMNLDQVRYLLWDTWDRIINQNITLKEADALHRAANQRIVAIRKELLDDPQKARKLLGGDS
jgi:hypothetical protein